MWKMQKIIKYLKLIASLINSNLLMCIYYAGKFKKIPAAMFFGMPVF